LANTPGTMMSTTKRTGMIDRPGISMGAT